MNEFESNLNKLFTNIFNYVLRFEEMSLKAMSNTPVTVTEAHILEIIGARNKRATVSEIASALSIAVPTATVAVKKLERKGFITKTACADDARRSIIGLTAAGEKINRAHNLFHKKMVDNVSRGLTETEKAVLISAVKKLNDFFKEKVEA